MASLGLPSMAEKEALRKVLSPHPTFSLPYSARSESGSGDVEVEAGEAPCLPLALLLLAGRDNGPLLIFWRGRGERRDRKLL